MTDRRSLHDVLLERVRDQRAVTHLKAYFREPLDADSSDDVFTGRLFERVARGHASSNAVTAGDLLAVEALSVNVPPEVAYQLLHGSLGRLVTEQLADTPNDLALGEGAATDHLRNDAAAASAWRLLEAADGVGWVTAGKLLARKRPALVPVYDRVTRCVMGSPASLWLDLDAAFRLDGGVVMHELDRVRFEASVPADVTRLRVLDVVLWMSHRRDHRNGTCAIPRSARRRHGEP